MLNFTGQNFVQTFDFVFCRVIGAGAPFKKRKQILTINQIDMVLIKFNKNNAQAHLGLGIIVNMSVILPLFMCKYSLYHRIPIVQRS